MLRSLCLASLLLLFQTAFAAAPKLTLVVGEAAPASEKQAAEQLSRDLAALFEATSVIQSVVPNDASSVILVGSPKTNPAIATDSWPKLSDQGHVLRSTPKGLVVGGSTPLATRWAASELAYHFGIRHLLQGDAMPIQKPALKLDGLDKVFDSGVKVRAWSAYFSPWDASSVQPHTAISWSLEEHQRLISQLVKLKFTHLILPAALVPFDPILVDGDVGGRSAFKGAKEFKAPMDNGILQQVEKLATEQGLVVTRQIPADLTPIPLGARSPSVLPEFGLSRLERDFQNILHSDTKGFVAIAMMPGDLNAAVHYACRVSFNSSLAAEKSLENLVTPICGEEVSARLWKGFQQIEKAADLIRSNDASFGMPSPTILLRHLESKETPPAWITEAKTLYAGAMSEMYRGNTRARGGARPFILYHAKRLEFAMQFCASAEALRKAGHAKVGKDEALQSESAEQGLEAIYNALNAYADVARDSSDRAVIALLNEHGYRVLLEKLQ